MSQKSFLACCICAFAVVAMSSFAANPADPKRVPDPVEQLQISRTRRAAEMLLVEARILDSAIMQWSIEHSKPKGAMPTTQDLVGYVKKGTRLHAELAAGRTNDALGNPFTLRGVDFKPLISKQSVQQFASVVPPGYWETYFEGPDPSTGQAPTPTPFIPNPNEDPRITASRLAEDLKLIDTAIDLWALKNDKRIGDQPRLSDIIAYFKPGTRLHREISAGRLNDSLGNPITLPKVGDFPTISEITAKKLSPYVPADYWKTIFKPEFR